MTIEESDATRRRHVSPMPNALTPEQLSVYTSIAEGPRKGQTALVPVVDEDGRLLGPFGLMIIAPAIGEAVQAVGEALRFDGTLDPFAREMIILSVAARRRSGFEWFAHERIARTAGLSDVQLTAIHDGFQPPALDARHLTIWKAMRPILDGDPLSNDLRDAAVTEIGEHGVAEIVWLCGYYSMLATALTVFDPELPDAVDDIFRGRAGSR